MSDDRKGGFGGGPKKPRATFGDVMLGIPSGGGRDERPKRDERGGGRGEGPRRRDGGRSEGSGGGAPGGQAAAGAESGRPQGEGRRGGQERGGRRGGPGGGGEPARAKGPLVVVKRASGVVETRAPGAPVAAAEPTGTPGAEDASVAVSESASPALEATTPAQAAPPAATSPRRSALFEEVPENETFGEMFEAQMKQEAPGTRRPPRVGEKVTGTIFQLGADTAFVSLGGRHEAMIELRELKDDEGILRHGVGDTIEAHVTQTGAKGILLSRALTKGSANLSRLAEARLSGMPVEGMVLSVNKGGLEVAIGDVRAFCPISQVDVRFVEKPDQFVGEKLMFRVTEVRDRNVVLSRRALLEEEQAKKGAETRKSLAEGKVVSGKVTSVRDFGAFVDLGGVEGMIPVSELSHTRVGHPSEVVKVGDEIEVEVIRMEAGNPNSPDKAKQKERITLSLRSRQEDPWKAAAADLAEGARLKGKVVRLQPFGAFVELRPGVDGLIHVSALSERRIAHPRDVVQVGQEVWVSVEKVDPAEKRVGLRLITEEEASRPPEERPAAAAKPAAGGGPPAESAPRPKVGQVVTGKIDRIEPYGVFLKFPGGKGLVPASETGTDRGTDMKRHFQLDQELTAQVLEIDASGKIRLSLTAAKRAEERAEMDEYLKTQKPKQGGGTKGFGTFADLLKGRKLS